MSSPVSINEILNNVKNLKSTDSRSFTANQQLITLMKGAVLDNYLDSRTVELMVNSDGKVFIEKLGEPDIKQICTLDANTVTQIIKIVAGFHGAIVNVEHPICEGEFPLDGGRFEGIISPTSGGVGPLFSLRKKAFMIFSLDSYVEKGIMTAKQRDLIVKAVSEHLNILVVGGTGSGKTTLLNAIIAEKVRQFPNDRFGIIEDTGELQCSAKNYFQLRADSHASMTQLVKASLRLRPSTVLVGEVRGPEALDLIDVWNSGHPGGFATLHSNTAESGLKRLKMMISRNKEAPRDIDPLIGEVVNVIVNIVRDGKSKAGRVVRKIIRVKGFDETTGQYLLENYK